MLASRAKAVVGQKWPSVGNNRLQQWKGLDLGQEVDARSEWRVRQKLPLGRRWAQSRCRCQGGRGLAHVGSSFAESAPCRSTLVASTTLDSR